MIKSGRGTPSNQWAWRHDGGLISFELVGLTWVDQGLTMVDQVKAC